MKTMKSMYRSRKGIFYTLALSFLALALLSLAILFFQHAASAESRHAELSFSQKLYDLDTSVQQVFAEAFKRKTDIILRSTLHSLTLEENIPQSFSELNSLVLTLKNEVENESNVNVTVATFTNHPLIFKPSDIIIEHPNATTIHVLPSQNITGYNISLIFTEDMTSCVWNIAGGTRSIAFTAQSDASNCAFSQSGVGEATITMVVDGKTVLVDIDGDGELLLESNSPVKSNVTINVNELSQGGHFEAYIGIEIVEAALGFSKKSNVLLQSLS